MQLGERRDGSVGRTFQITRLPLAVFGLNGRLGSFFVVPFDSGGLVPVVALGVRPRSLVLRKLCLLYMAGTAGNASHLVKVDRARILCPRNPAAAGEHPGQDRNGGQIPESCF